MADLDEIYMIDKLSLSITCLGVTDVLKDALQYPVSDQKDRPVLAIISLYLHPAFRSSLHSMENKATILPGNHPVPLP